MELLHRPGGSGSPRSDLDNARSPTDNRSVQAVPRRIAIVLVAVLLAGTAAAGASAAPATHAATAQHAAGAAVACKRGYYRNSSGRCVRRPGRDPAGATARCRDGTYSDSQHASGTCSHHGGVARWIRHP
jgi:uncharacterized membrane protein YgcG